MNWQHEAWVKLYKREEGTFASLDFLARGVAAMLLKHAEADGRIGLRPGEDLWTAVCARAGVKRHERKQVRRIIDVLIADGYVVVGNGFAAIRNYSSAQKRKSRHQTNDNPGTRKEDDAETKSASVESQRRLNGASTVPLPCLNGASAVPLRGTNGDSAGIAKEVKQAKSLDSQSQHPSTRSVDPIRSEEIEENENTRPPSGGRAGVKTRQGDVYKDVLASFCETWQKRFNDAYTVTPRDRQHFGTLIQTLEHSEAYRLPELFRRYLADADPFNAKQGYALWWFCSGGLMNRYKAQGAPASASAQASRAAPVPDDRCTFHRDPANATAQLARNDFVAWCRVCKRIGYRQLRKEQGELTLLGEALPDWMEGKTWEVAAKAYSAIGVDDQDAVEGPQLAPGSTKTVSALIGPANGHARTAELIRSLSNATQQKGSKDDGK